MGTQLHRRVVQAIASKTIIIRPVLGSNLQRLLSITVALRYAILKLFEWLKILSTQSDCFKHPWIKFRLKFYLELGPRFNTSDRNFLLNREGLKPREENSNVKRVGRTLF